VAVDPQIRPAALAVELRPLGHVAQAGPQRSDRVRLGVVLAEVLGNELAERGEVMAANCDGIAVAPRLNLAQGPLEERLRLSFTLAASAKGAPPRFACLITPTGRPALAALGKRFSLRARHRLLLGLRPRTRVRP
jgi:hypothetical protein